MTQPDSPSIADVTESRTRSRSVPAHDRPWVYRAWYGVVRWFALSIASACGPLRVSGRNQVPKSGGALMVSNHLSYLDVFIVGLAVPRPLNYVARSTLFLPVLGSLIRSVGGFPIQRDGMGASGLKETLKRLRNGGIVILFPEGTRTPDGRLGSVKSGIAVLAQRARVPIVPVGLAGTFESWPRRRLLPRPHAIRAVVGAPISPESLVGLDSDSITRLIHDRIAECHQDALAALARDLQIPAPESSRP